LCNIINYVGELAKTLPRPPSPSPSRSPINAVRWLGLATTRCFLGERGAGEGDAAGAAACVHYPCAVDESASKKAGRPQLGLCPLRSANCPIPCDVSSRMPLASRIATQFFFNRAGIITKFDQNHQYSIICSSQTDWIPRQQVHRPYLTPTRPPLTPETWIVRCVLRVAYCSLGHRHRFVIHNRQSSASFYKTAYDR
jgi:hypothetical protein